MNLVNFFRLEAFIKTYNLTLHLLTLRLRTQPPRREGLLYAP
ncbi:MAG: hypothetical protein AAF267_06375 [Deinococcota bacterium]